MNLSIPVSVSSKVAMATLKVKANSPTILFGAGVVLGVATVVAACRATLKVEAVLDEAKQGMEIANVLEHSDTAEYTEVDKRKDKAYVYAITARKLTILYGPAVLLGIGSIACLTQSHRILTQRNVALTAAYSAVDKAFKAYRGRVAEEYGAEKELEIFHDVKKVDAVGEDGKTKKQKRSQGGGSGYSRFFDEYNKNWDSNPDYRIAFLRLSQNQLNDQLNARGHLFLNEVYDQLGMERSEAGQAVGWLSNKHPEAKDGEVDFGIFTNRSKEEFYNFAAGLEGVWIDFNVDGTIMDKI